jgi:hypothetical protein
MIGVSSEQAYLNGGIHEVQLYRVLRTAEERTALETGLMSKWGVAS